MATGTRMTMKQGLAIKARLKHERMRAVKAERDEAIREAVAAGISVRQIASIVGISHQRVSQIVHDGS